MNTDALEKTHKAKRIAEAILRHLEKWLRQMSIDHGTPAKYSWETNKIYLDEITPNDLNKLVEEFMEIIERDL